MVSKNQIKIITSLQQKKYRISEKAFLAEGVKVVQELVNSNFELVHLYTTKNDFTDIGEDQKTLVSENELCKISALTAANSCLAIFKIKAPKPPKQNGFIVALDAIRDPGNLGTIIRLCDWFGIEEIICSTTTVDMYNPKVVQASMGSIARVNVNYVDLAIFFETSDLPVFGAFMDGISIYKEQLPNNGIIVMGNEANGISKALENSISKRIAIPRFGNLKQTESLNVATATAIILSEFRRNS